MRRAVLRTLAASATRRVCPMCTLLEVDAALVFASGLALGAAMATYKKPTDFCSAHWQLVTGQLALVGLSVGPDNAAARIEAQAQGRDRTGLVVDIAAVKGGIEHAETSLREPQHGPPMVDEAVEAIGAQVVAADGARRA